MLIQVHIARANEQESKTGVHAENCARVWGAVFNTFCLKPIEKLSRQLAAWNLVKNVNDKLHPVEGGVRDKMKVRILLHLIVQNEPKRGASPVGGVWQEHDELHRLII